MRPSRPKQHQAGQRDHRAPALPAGERQTPPAHRGQFAPPQQLGQRGRQQRPGPAAGKNRFSRCQHGVERSHRTGLPVGWHRLDAGQEAGARAGTGCKSYNRAVSVFALGLNHTTAPLDLRGRFAFAPDQLPPALHGLRERLQRAAPEAALVSTCNRTELYVAAEPRSAPETGAPGAGLAGRAGRRQRQPAAGPHLCARGPRRRAPRLPRRRRARFDGARRAADPRPDEAGGAPGRRRRHPGHARCTSCSSARSRWPRRCAPSTEIGAHSISMAAASVRLAAQLFEDLREIQVLFVGAGEMIELVATHFAARQPKAMARGQPHARARREAGQPLRRPGAAPVGPARSPARVRRRRLLHRQLAADHRPGRRRAGAEGAPPSADVHGRPGRAARHRARGARSWPTSTSTPSTTCRPWCRPPARSARPRCSRPRPSSTPAC